MINVVMYLFGSLVMICWVFGECFEGDCVYLMGDFSV